MIPHPQLIKKRFRINPLVSDDNTIEIDICEMTRRANKFSKILASAFAAYPPVLTIDNNEIYITIPIVNAKNESVDDVDKFVQQGINALIANSDLVYDSLLKNTTSEKDKQTLAKLSNDELKAAENFVKLRMKYKDGMVLEGENGNDIIIEKIERRGNQQEDVNNINEAMFLYDGYRLSKKLIYGFFDENKKEVVHLMVDENKMSDAIECMSESKIVTIKYNSFLDIFSNKEKCKQVNLVSYRPHKNIFSKS